MPQVSRLSIAPVRSLGLEHRDEIFVTEVGVLEDRRFFLADDTNRLVDRLIVGELVQIATHTDPDATTLRLTFPDGEVVEDEVQLGAAIETPIHGRTGVGHVVVGPWAAKLSAFCAPADHRWCRCDRPAGTRAGNPTSLVSDGSLTELARHVGVGAVDARRFRMLIELSGADRPTKRTAGSADGSRSAMRSCRSRPGTRAARSRPRTPPRGDPRSRHPADDHRLPRSARWQARRLRRPRRRHPARGDPARR